MKSLISSSTKTTKTTTTVISSSRNIEWLNEWNVCQFKNWIEGEKKNPKKQLKIVVGRQKCKLYEYLISMSQFAQVYKKLQFEHIYTHTHTHIWMSLSLSCLCGNQTKNSWSNDCIVKKMSHQELLFVSRISHP